MRIVRETPRANTFSITLTRDEAERLDNFLIDGPLWHDAPDEKAHAGGPLAEALSKALTEAFNL